MTLRAVGSVPTIYTFQRLFQLLSANMAITTDQQFTKLFSGTLWDPQFIVADYVSGAFSVACAGGIFSGANKTGSAIVSTGQSWSSLASGPNTQVNATVQANITTFNVTPFFSLTTGNTGALVANLYIYGFCFDN